MAGPPLTRGARHLPALLVGTVGLIGCAALVLLLAYRHTLRIDFTPERSRGDNVYEAAAAHFKALGKAGKRPLLAAYSEGSRSRIASILKESGTALKTADSWQEALGASAGGKPVAMVLPPPNRTAAGSEPLTQLLAPPAMVVTAPVVRSILRR